MQHINHASICMRDVHIWVLHAPSCVHQHAHAAFGHALVHQQHRSTGHDVPAIQLTSSYTAHTAAAGHIYNIMQVCLQLSSTSWASNSRRLMHKQ